MLRQRLATHFAFFFVSLLLSVTGDEGFPTNNFESNRFPLFISVLKEKCFQRSNPLSCATRQEEIGSEPLKQSNELSLEKDNSEENPSRETSVETPFINFENQLEKRLTVFRRKNPVARGYKRGPGFRSWGGKRDSQSLEKIDKKSKFASWGGKRNEHFFLDESIVPDSGETNAVNKRSKFQNCEGKKSKSDYLEEIGKRGNKNSTSYGQIEKKGSIWKNRGFYLSQPFKKHVPKRPQFQSWGGKRALHQRYQFFEFLQPRSRFLLNGDEKRKFSSWGGKRSHDYENQKEEKVKRHAFRNWGGKRLDFDKDILRDDTNVTKELDKINARAYWENLDSGDDEPREETNK